MKIGLALIVGFVTAALLVGIMGSATYAGISAENEKRVWVSETITPKIDALQDIKSASVLLSSATHELVMAPLTTPGDNVLASAKSNVQLQQSKIRTSFQIYSQIVTDKFPDEATSRDALSSKLDAFLAADNELILSKEQFSNGRVQSQYDSPEFLAAHSRYMQAEVTLFNSLDDQWANDRVQSQMIRDSVTTNLSNLVNGTVIFTIISAALIGLSGYLIYRSFGIPLKNLKVGVDKIAKGNFKVEIREIGRNDEVGSLARAIDTMQKELYLREGQKDEFISIASHELRTPIQPILGYATLAKLGKVSSDRAWDAVLREARRLQRLSNDILDVTKIGSNTLEYRIEKVNIPELLENIVRSTSANLRQGVTISFVSDESNKGLIIAADRSRITQVFTNIIENAKKFTEQGVITIKCEILVDEGSLKITISDCGKGISSEIMPVLFKKFATKSHGEATGEGTGLGLYISKAIINAHGGDIFAKNIINSAGSTSGASFEIILPIKGNDKSAAFLPKAKQETKNEPLIKNVTTS